MNRKPQVPKVPRVIGYVRISRAREDETSTVTQEAAIRAYCAAHGWQVVDIVIEPGRSAFKASRASRPGFKKAMGFITGGAADTFVVWKLDRAARNTLDLLKFVREELEGHGAQFVSVTENFDTTTGPGRAMMTIVAALAELESAQKSERALEWHELRRDRQIDRTGTPPRGYCKVGNSLRPSPDAKLITKAVKRMVAGDSLNSVLSWLNAEGMKISHAGLVSVFRNPTIAGLVSTEPMYDDRGKRVRTVDPTTLVEGKWKPLVTRGEWEQVQLIINDTSRRTNTTNKLQHPLRPIVRCHCGSGMRIQSDNRKYQNPRYQCVRPGCANGITLAPVDKFVSEAVLSQLPDPKWRALRATGAPAGPDPAVIEAELAKMWKAYLAHRLDLSEYTEAKALWYGELAAAGNPVDLPNVESLVKSWDSMPPAEKNLVYRRAIKTLIINPSTRRGRGVDLDRVDLDLIDGYQSPPTG